MKKEPETKTSQSNNPFYVLGEEMVEGDTSKEKSLSKKQDGKTKELEGEDVQQMEVIEEDEGEEMELGELDLDVLEAGCGKKEQGYVSRRQIELLEEAIIRTGAHQNLGIDPNPQKGNKRKSPEEELRRGRKTNKQCIAAVGIKLIESGQYLKISAVFYEVNKVCE